MTFFGKILLVLLLVIGAGFAGYFLRTPSAEVPKLTTNENVQNLDSETVLPNTESTPVEKIATQIKNPITQTGITLDMSNRGFTEVPRTVFDEKSIEILNLSGNKLISLQAEIHQLANLRMLNLSNNMLTNIPAELGQLSNLETLNLSNNRLTGLPYELGNLKNLKTLDLRGNNYAKADLDIVKNSLPTSTVILTD